MTTKQDDDLTVLKCWDCRGGFNDSGPRGPRGAMGLCRRCAGTGSIFWVDGRSYPYTPEGEKYVRRLLRSDIPQWDKT